MNRDNTNRKGLKLTLSLTEYDMLVSDRVKLNTIKAIMSADNEQIADWVGGDGGYSIEALALAKVDRDHLILQALAGEFQIDD